MNAKEMEAAIKAMTEDIQSLRTDQRKIGEQAIIAMASDLEALKTEAEAIRALNYEGQLTAINNKLTAVAAEVEATMNDVSELVALMGASEEDGPFYPELKAISARLEDISAKVDGRNKSAPTKRNMTDVDALQVLTGDLKDLSHKDAAEKIGLTYAQIYSCRLEFTFKHVHKELRDEKWENPWAK